ncbi:MAG TPA: MBL fold metallo-hydrolase, partial [Gemmatimonadales bacterium]|nr:MBL fold metallo-hydrolase [Gemmatimonadales bacterium]
AQQAAPAPAPAGPPAPPMRIDVERLGPRLLVFSGYTNGNVLAIASDTGTLLVDAQSPRRERELDSALVAERFPRVTSVILTHYHEDHLGGNARYRAGGAQLVAHERMAVQAAKDTVIAERTWTRKAAAPEMLPTRTFRDSLVMRLGDEEVRVWHAPNAHTEGDAVIRLMKADVVHLGDILELQAPPFIDWWAGGTVDGMIAALDHVLAITGPGTRFVPGHGPVTDRAGVIAYRAMLDTLRTRMRALAARKATAEDAVRENPVAEYAPRLGGERRARQLLDQLVYGYLVRGVR